MESSYLYVLLKNSMNRFFIVILDIIQCLMNMLSEAIEDAYVMFLWLI